MKKILTIIAFIILGFWLGTQYEAWRYDDICLDMGGGKNPGGYPICVIEK
jgi:hypothetical protein